MRLGMRLATKYWVLNPKCYFTLSLISSLSSPLCHPPSLISPSFIPTFPGSLHFLCSKKCVNCGCPRQQHHSNCGPGSAPFTTFMSLSLTNGTPPVSSREQELKEKYAWFPPGISADMVGEERRFSALQFCLRFWKGSFPVFPSAFHCCLQYATGSYVETWGVYLPANCSESHFDHYYIHADFQNSFLSHYMIAI